MADQPELPLEFPESKGTSRYGEPVTEIAEGAKAYAARKGRKHHFEDFANTQATDSHSALYPAVRASFGEPLTARMQQSYAALRKEIPKQYEYLTSPKEKGGLGISVEVTHENPYSHPREMHEDIKTNRRIRVLSTESTGAHALFSNEENDQFRAIHDVFGHLSIGRDFSKHGEEAAYSSHAQMFSKKALPALVSETRAQNSYYLNAGDFPPNAPVNVPQWATNVRNMPPTPKGKKSPKINQLQFDF